MTARGTGAHHPEEGSRGSVRPLTTEKMLSANREMSNIFLQRGQNIDITHKKSGLRPPNFGSWRGLAFYLR
jgi:hypothetical protein